MVEILPFLPPADDIVIKIGHAVEQLSETPFSEITTGQVLNHETGKQVSIYAALKNIAFTLECIAEAALAYEQDATAAKAQSL